ncbi:sensor histidine kinase [Geoalkalibacter sp.]|uniref:sensor histidine kinase n=1 Tax=Geoalkalibacter sp. TaxID=3041440 RepID=UPI00272ED3B2|nr:ATP-binding protein [Geoalkalibacter sp.]
MAALSRRRRKRLVWQLFPAFALVILIALGAAGLHVSHALKAFYLRQTIDHLQGLGRLVEQSVAAEPLVMSAELQALAQRLGRGAGVRVTLIAPDGQVLADSDELPTQMDNHANRPEVRQALLGAVGSELRYSHTLLRNLIYVAVPVERDGRIVGCVRTALAATDIEENLRTIHQRMLAGGLGAALLAALISLGLARRISRPLEEIRRGAERFAQGDLGRRLPVEGSAEIASLAEALNLMAAQLDERLQTMLSQRNEQEAVLGSMVEGVLAVDTDERLIRINSAAASLLGVDGTAAQGRVIHEVVRKADLQRFVARALNSSRPVEGDMVLHGARGELFLQAHGSPLRDSHGRNIGALVVLNDVTRLRRLERIRSDFVANVSHELKTPITAIRGFVETLLDGALDKPEDARRFLDIILRQSERLHSIIEDLLALSRIEQESERGGLEVQEGPLQPVLAAAIQVCEPAATAKALRVRLVCPEGLSAAMSAPLLEQALVNLIDNAVKYSPPGKDILVEAGGDDEGVLIRVRDWGVGISREHLPRLFERFYRVDKARSRKQGGTGLGLAIVKHIVQAHGGQISVESTPGEGSTFSLRLPRRRAERPGNSRA